ncbi:MAG: hypothetical protein H6624_12650 [Bdellovibrionaceae bacterium]|nr:hypothetical protein [Bdellovibrionales bacterium]MCB9085194.1 hypothetical protein [Pseudobdellovibrionaceae bacterium]
MFYYQPQWGSHHDSKPELIFEHLRILNVRGTPTFFENGRALDDFGMESLRRLIKEEVDKAYR